MTTTFGYLTFSRWRGDTLNLPTGLARYPRGQGAAAADQWYRENIQPAARSKHQATVEGYREQSAAYEARVRAWRQEIRRVENVERRRGSRLMGERYFVDVVTWPDGTEEEVQPGHLEIEIQRQIDAKFEKPEPPPAFDDQVEMAAWVSGCLRSDVHTWLAEFTDGATNTDVPVTLSLGWSTGAPLGDIARHLARLAAEGWELILASEDKGLYAGIDTGNVSAPTRMRFLLKRVEG